jgi:uncharacterized repeat protein (TIGR03803 family)
MFRTTFLSGAGVGILMAIGLAVPAAAEVLPLHVPGKGEGFFPSEGVIAATNGSLYGVMQNSSAGRRDGLRRGCGLVYRINPKGVYSTLLDFSDLKHREGCRAAGELLLDGGQLYGLTFEGGRDNHGTLYRLSLKGTHEVLHAFSGEDGSLPVGGLRRGADGMLYGATQSGGQHDAGTLFRIDRQGRLETLHHFQHDTPLGAGTRNPLVLATDGAMYGTSMSNIVGRGVIYRVTAAGAIELVRTLSTEEGCYPSGLSQGSDGWLYGAAMLCGQHGLGTLYRVHPDGRLQTLHHFSGEDGSGPRDRPVQHMDGTWYGTTMGYLPGSAGTLYRFRTEAGAGAEVLHQFNLTPEGGISPWGPLLATQGGAIYGTTQRGGNAKGPLGTGPGMVYRYPPDEPR